MANVCKKRNPSSSNRAWDQHKLQMGIALRSVNRLQRKLSRQVKRMATSPFLLDAGMALGSILHTLEVQARAGESSHLFSQARTTVCSKPKLSITVASNSNLHYQEKMSFFQQ